MAADFDDTTQKAGNERNEVMDMLKNADKDTIKKISQMLNT